MERKIGEIFTHKGKTYKILKAIVGCKGCIFCTQQGTCIIWHMPMPQGEDCRKSHTPVFMDLFLLAIKLQNMKRNGLKFGLRRGGRN